MNTFELRLQEIQTIAGGGEIVGDSEFICRGVASLKAAKENELSFVKNERYIGEALDSRAGALIVPAKIAESHANQLIVDEPFLAFGHVLQQVAREKRRQQTGIHPTAVISNDVELGDDITIGAGVFIRENVQIGDRVVIYSNVTIGQRSVIGSDSILHPGVIVMEDVTLGSRVIVHGGTVLGVEGYGYIQHEGKHVKIPQVGSVIIGDDVEIGALTTIARAALDATIIARGTKIGDLVHVGHNCVVGEDVLLFPTVAISGSVHIGNKAIFAGRSGASDNLKIGDGAIMGATSVAFKDVAPGAVMWGDPARTKVQQMRIQTVLTGLPEMRKELRTIRKDLDRMK